MKETSKICGINLAIFLVYTVIVRVIVGGDDATASLVLVVFTHAGFNLWFALVNKKDRKQGQVGALLLSALLISYLGISFCTGVIIGPIAHPQITL